jgi:hypothetical protein
MQCAAHCAEGAAGVSSRDGGAIEADWKGKGVAANCRQQLDNLAAPAISQLRGK